MGEALSPELMDIVQRATAPAPLVTGELVEPKEIEGRLCLTCNNPSTRSDGRCARCATTIRKGSDILADAAARMANRGIRYADLHLEAAERAAAKGDAGPAQRALEGLGVLKPTERQGSGPQVVVQIGMILPGLPGAE